MTAPGGIAHYKLLPTGAPAYDRAHPGVLSPGRGMRQQTDALCL